MRVKGLEVWRGGKEKGHGRGKKDVEVLKWMGGWKTRCDPKCEALKVVGGWRGGRGQEVVEAEKRAEATERGKVRLRRGRAG